MEALWLLALESGVNRLALSQKSTLWHRQKLPLRAIDSGFDQNILALDAKQSTPNTDVGGATTFPPRLPGLLCNRCRSETSAVVNRVGRE